MIGAVPAAAPFVPGGVGPEQTQAQILDASLRTGIMGGGVGQGRVPYTDPGDHGTPQHFATQPSYTDAVHTAAVGDDSGAEQFPGRIRIHSSDGEPGWAAVWGSGL